MIDSTLRWWGLALVSASLWACGSGIGVTLPPSADGVADGLVGDADVGAPDRLQADEGPAPDDAMDASVGPLDVGGGPADVEPDSDAPGTIQVFVQEQTGLSTDNVYKGVWAGEAGRVVAVGNDGVIVERAPDGDWSVKSQGEGSELLNAVSGVSGEALWAVGKGGTILQVGGGGAGDGGGCVEHADCDNGDPCTDDFCEDGVCEAEAAGGPGCCGSIAASWGFDTGDLQGWTVTSSFGGLTWQAHSYIDIFTGQPLYTSPSHALFFGDPSKSPPNFDSGQIVGGAVVSPPLALPVSGSATLSFQVFMDSEASTSFDVLLAQVESTGGVVTDVWTKAEIGPIPTQGFVAAEADLSSWAGQTIKLRFSFDSVDSLINQGLGPWIDDVVVDTSCDGADVPGTTFPTLWGVHAIEEDDVYAVGLGGAILHYDGKSWKSDAGSATGATWYGMHGSGQTIVLVGSGGAIQRTTGQGLEPVSAPAAVDLHDVHSADEAVFWVVGDLGTVLRGEGAEFALIDVPTNADLHGVHVAGPDEVFVVGDGGTLLRFDGSDWAAIELPDAGGVIYDLFDVTDVGDGELLITGGNGFTLYGHPDTGFTSLGPLTGGSDLHAAWGTGGEGFLVGEDSAVYRFTGVSAIPQIVQTTQHLRSVWGAATNDVWAVGLAGVVLHFDGLTWTQIDDLPVGSAFEVLWGNASDDVYAAGHNGVIMHWDGEVWALVASKTDMNLRGVYGFPGGPVWAVGGFGTIMTKGAFGWSQVPIEPIVQADETEEPILDLLYAIWAAAPDDAWAVGDGGRVVHWDGETWSNHDAGHKITLRGLYGRAPDDIFAVGSEGQIIRYDGEAWEQMPSGSVATLYAVHGDLADQVVITGDIGTVLRLTEVDAPAEP